MAKISREESQKRREEIIDVAQELYQELPFQDINIKEIGQRLSFTRTAIYTYFDNKEEIYLALLEREYRLWEQDLQELLEVAPLDRDQFAKSLAKSLDKRLILLKISAIDMIAIDAKSRLDCLISFKAVYGRALDLVRQVLERHFPERTAEDNQSFVFAFFPFLYGVYPYTSVTDKQRQAMEVAQVSYHYMTVSEMIENCILRLL